MPLNPCGPRPFLPRRRTGWIALAILAGLIVVATLLI